MALLLPDAQKIIGIKQVSKALKDKKAVHVFVARDADPYIIKPIIDGCHNGSVKITYVDTMKELGESAQIDVGASVVAMVE